MIPQWKTIVCLLEQSKPIHHGEAPGEAGSPAHKTKYNIRNTIPAFSDGCFVFMPQLQDTPYNVFSTDNTSQLSPAQYGDPSEVVLYEALGNIDQALVLVETNGPLGHEVFDFARPVLDIVQQAQNVFFRDDTRQAHIGVNDRQPRDVVLHHSPNSFIYVGFSSNGNNVGCHNLFCLEHITAFPFMFQILRLLVYRFAKFSRV